MTVTDVAEHTSVIHTACTLDCPDACSLAVTVTDGRITDVDASPDNPFTDGWICAKVKRHAQRVYAPERVMTPLVRTGPKGAGEFREATWEEATALDRGAHAAAAIDRNGADAVVAFTYNSSAAVLERASLSEAFFAAIGATIIDHTICAETMGAAWESVYGDMASADPRDVVNSKLVVIWGANPTVSNTHFPPLVQQAVAAGRRSLSSIRVARQWPSAPICIWPSGPVLTRCWRLAIANHWASNGHLDREFFEAHSTGADEFLAAAAEWSIERAAEVTGLGRGRDPDAGRLVGQHSAHHAAYRLGAGAQRERWCLVPGNPCVAGTRRALRPAAAAASSAPPPPAPPSRASVGRRKRSTICRAARCRCIRSAQWMAPGSGDPCEVLFVQGSNPLVMCPDQQAVVAAFSREDVFTIVHEQVLTDTTRYADVVLPATTSFEISDVTSSYGSLMVMPVAQVIPPVGESRSNDETGLAFARAFGFDWSAPDISLAVADAGPREAVVPSRQFVDTFPAGEQAQLIDPVQGVPRHVELPVADGSLILISPASSKLVNSMFGEFQSPSPAILLHPVDAAAAGVVAGQTVRVWNETRLHHRARRGQR